MVINYSWFLMVPLQPYEACREVMLWTNHRVMEWLRTVDLSEYAPNLRGSGIHGALMVRMQRFRGRFHKELGLVLGDTKSVWLVLSLDE